MSKITPKRGLAQWDVNRRCYLNSLSHAFSSSRSHCCCRSKLISYFMRFWRVWRQLYFAFITSYKCKQDMKKSVKEKVRKIFFIFSLTMYVFFYSFWVFFLFLHVFHVLFQPFSLSLSNFVFKTQFVLLDQHLRAR